MKDETKQKLFAALDTEARNSDIQLRSGFKVQERRDADNKLIGVDVDVAFAIAIHTNTSTSPRVSKNLGLKLRYKFSPQMSEAIQAAEGKPEQESLLSEAIVYFTREQMCDVRNWVLSGCTVTSFRTWPTIYTPKEVNDKARKKNLENRVIENAKLNGYSNVHAEIRVTHDSHDQPTDFIVTLSGTKHGASLRITEVFHDFLSSALEKKAASLDAQGGIICEQLFLKADGLVKDYVSLGRAAMSYKVAGTMFALGAAASSVATLALTGVIEFAKLATAAGIVFSNPVTAAAATAVFLVAALVSFGLGARAVRDAQEKMSYQPI